MHVSRLLPSTVFMVGANSKIIGIVHNTGRVVSRGEEKDPWRKSGGAAKMGAIRGHRVSHDFWGGKIAVRPGVTL